MPSGFEQNENQIDVLNNPMPVGVIDRFPDGSPASGYGSLGLFTLHLDTSALKAELTPLRNSSSTDVLEVVDITNFLSMVPCSDCAKIMGISLDADNNPVVSIGIKHPFPAGDQLKPISGRNRADLHVFNIEGTVVLEDSVNNTTFSGLGDTIGPGYLLNADGYSPYLDIPLDDIFNTNATIHPYILHFDDYTVGNFNPSSPTGFDSVVDPPPSGNLVMAMGCDYDLQDYVFSIPDDESFDFIYAVGCTYAVSATNKNERFTPEYQIPQHNKKAASEVSVEFTTNDLAAGDPLSSAELLISVLDINHDVAVGEGLDQMKADSSVSGILIEVPGVTNGIVVGSATPTGGNGRDPSDPLTFTATFYNELSTGEGVFPGLVKVLDSYPAGLNESPLLNGQDAIKRVSPIQNPLDGLYTLDEFATYMIFHTIIAEECGPIVEGSFTAAPNCDDPVIGDIEIIDGETVTFSATGFSSMNANILYEWDFGDGSPYDTSGADVSHAYTNINCGGTNDDVVYPVTLTVSDDCFSPSTPVVQSIDITVKCVRDDMTLSPSAETAVSNSTPYGTVQHRYSPALSQDDDGDFRMAVYHIDLGTFHQDWSGVMYTNDGLNWILCQGMTGGSTGGYHDTPIKITPNKGQNYSYAAHTWGTDPRVSSAKCSWEGFNFDFASFYSQHNRELFSNRTTGYLFYFTSPGDSIQMQRSPVPYTVDFVNGIRFQNFGTFADGDDARLSLTRSCAEDETTGIMYLVYYRNAEDSIRLATSDTSTGDTWTLSTVFEDTTGTYNTIVNPTIDIDIDNRMHISYLRHNITSDITELVYMQSVDFGQTFCITAVVDTGTSMSEPTIEAFDYLDHDWAAICYEKDGHIYLALSEDQGHSFGHMMQISEYASPNSEPDIIMTTNGWLQFAWTNGTPMVDGQLYVRKIDLSN